MKKRILSFLLAAVMIISTFTACSSNKSSAEATNQQKSATEEIKTESTKIKEQIVYGTPTTVAGTFNPLISYLKSDGIISSIVYPSLLQFDDKGELIPYLAESHEVSDDYKTITFHLNKNAKWEDDKPVTADDVIYTLEAIADPDLVGGSDFYRVEKIVGAADFHEGKAESIEGIKKLDDYTVQLLFTEPYAPVLIKLGTYSIIPKHIWSKIPMAEWEKATEALNNPVGCGPYKVVKVVPDQYVEMEASKTFFGGKVKTPKFILKIISPDSISAELKSGNIDIVGVKELRKSEIDALSSQGFKEVSIPDEMYQYIAFNLRRPQFQDKNLRQAMVYAIDRKLIVEKLLEGRGTLLDAPILPGGWADTGDVLNNYAYNPEKAIELLEASGWKDKDGDGIRENEKGEKLQFKLRCSNDSKAREQAVMYIQECWKNVGIQVEVSVEEDAKMTEDCIYNHNFEMYALNCYFGEDPDLYGWWHSESAHDEVGTPSWNFGAYKNEKVDKLIKDAQMTLDKKQRKSYYLEIAKQINEDAPMVFIYAQNREMMCASGLKDFKPSTFNILYNISNWVIEE